jgi:hypothetical protein
MILPLYHREISSAAVLKAAAVALSTTCARNRLLAPLRQTVAVPVGAITVQAAHE